jgi:hypothetical protein
MTAYSPSGAKIVGTFDVVECMARILPETFEKKGKGVDFEYEGETEVWWCGQKTQKKRGQRLFVDENHEIWPENKLTLKED